MKCPYCHREVEFIHWTDLPHQVECPECQSLVEKKELEYNPDPLDVAEEG